jgi:hypothetical protein
MIAAHHNLSSKKPVPALCGTGLTLTETPYLLDHRSADQPIDLTGFKDLSDRAMKNVEDMLGAFIRERRTPINNLTPVEQNPVHRST